MAADFNLISNRHKRYLPERIKIQKETGIKMDKKKLALIHIIKKELNLGDKEYRNILQAASGVSSAKDLDDNKFRSLMNYFARSEYYQVNQFGLTIRQKLYIKSLANGISWTEVHLNNFLRKYFHKEAVDQLTRREAMGVIESLKNIKIRTKD